ncbi:hypothetical protein [Bradyrhizobium sp. CCBAU 25360]|uniref:hypothetical protein n=1 Tax=Bradyrhizobium sp. CCBAU 25360 TaxID=858425 RepID=UPI0023067CB3|nr:hypothetical protein [Bradyrhizobium sp. CCBAU 25360]
MAIDLKAVEQLATDQSSLKAAAGLAKPAKWSGVGMSRDAALIWVNARAPALIRTA